MKTLAAVVAVLALTAGFCLADQWVGWVTDQKCASSGRYTGDHQKCVEAGQPVVFVSEADKKVYKLADQDKAKEYVGKKVTIEGSAEGDTIVVQQMSASAGQ